ncbi:MAG: hypothetical protein VKM97_02995 [Cyanobacteriota bacterium]|nr:hypothetical protein [Cyanobacteriota bacterium]
MDEAQQPQSATGAPPPLPPQPRWGDAVQGVFHWNRGHGREQLLEQELSAARDELQAMQTLLEELPEIFERKFEARLRPVLEQQYQLLQDNATMRQQLQALQPAPTPPASRLLLPPSLKRVLPWSRARRRPQPDGHHSSDLAA